MASTSQQSQEKDRDQADGSSKVKVTILASEWGSSKGGLSTINRELAIQLAKCPEVEITFFLPKCNEEDKNIALRHKIEIVEATRRPGYDELEWLSFPPKNLQIDVIVGHGVKLGRQAQVIRDSKKSRWVQVVHTDPEELGMFKNYLDPISKGEEKHKTEVELCEMADLVVGVGPKLSEAFRSYLRGCQNDLTVLDFTPGVFDVFGSVKQAPNEGKNCSILVFGRGDAEDFEVKGFDIAGKAVATLSNTRLVFVGAPDGKHEEIAQQFSGCGIPASCLRVRGYVKNREHLKRLFQEVDLVLMPSRTEGFGLTGLEALSAGCPVLVSQNSGFGEALSKVPFGSSFVVDSEDPKLWAEAIKRIWNKDSQGRLEEAEMLRSSYDKKYSWAKQSKDLVDKMISIVHGPPPVEERQQFPNLNDMRPALPHVQPQAPPGIYAPTTRRTTGLPQPQERPGIHVPAAVSGREPQEQAESHVPTPAESHTNYPSTSPTRVPQPQGSLTDTSRQPIPVQGAPGLDRTDAPDARTSVQVDPSLRQQLCSDGCFLNPEKYDPVKFLGSGGYAKVYLVIQKDTGKRMACKMCDLGTNNIDTQKLIKSIGTEFMALSALKHRHIVEFFYFEGIRKTALLFLEYMEGGTIEDLLRQRAEPLQELLVRKFTKQLLTGVDYLHNNGIKQVIHKDIKGGNILLDRLQTNLKLADFGICTIMEELKTATGGLVTKNNIASFHWTSPELLAGQTFGRNTDIWSVACTVVEMLTRKPPLFFDNLTMIQKMYRITNCQVEPPTDCTSVAFGFLKRCLCPKEERASAAQLLTDPFVSDV